MKLTKDNLISYVVDVLGWDFDEARSMTRLDILDCISSEQYDEAFIYSL